MDNSEWSPTSWSVCQGGKGPGKPVWDIKEQTNVKGDTHGQFVRKRYRNEAHLGQPDFRSVHAASRDYGGTEWQGVTPLPQQGLRFLLVFSWENRRQRTAYLAAKLLAQFINDPSSQRLFSLVYYKIDILQFYSGESSLLWLMLSCVK